MSRRSLSAIAALAGVSAGVAVGALVARENRRVPLLTTPHSPTLDLEEACERFGELTAIDAIEDIDPLCTSRLLHHDRRTERVFVLYHGYTNCPLQFAMLGDLLYEAGHNVLIPRVPRHGLADYMTEELSLLTSTELAEFTAMTVDIGAGLGDQLTVVGFSGGGTLASYAAHEMDSVSDVVLIAPLVTPHVVPNTLVRATYRITSRSPERYLWWNPLTREPGLLGPHAYPRFSTHSVGAYLGLSLGMCDTDPLRTTQLERVVLFTNENDLAVDNRAAIAFVDTVLGPWCDHVATVMFPRQMGLHHDWVDPLGVDGDKLDRGYPYLLEMLGVGEGAARPRDAE